MWRRVISQSDLARRIFSDGSSMPSVRPLSVLTGVDTPTGLPLFWDRLQTAQAWKARSCNLSSRKKSSNEGFESWSEREARHKQNGEDLETQLARMRETTEAPRKPVRELRDVIEILPDASYKAKRLDLKDAKLDPRDMSLFVQRKGYANQRATLAPRQGAILFRTEIARAIIQADKALIFPARREKDTLRLVQSLHTTLKFAEADMPFELSVLESLLSETVQHFERHHKRILLLSDSVEREIGEVLKTSAGDLTRLLPIQKSLTEMMQDVVETRDTIKDILLSEEKLSAICFDNSSSSSQSHRLRREECIREAALLLQSYERQISTIEGALKEKQDYLEVVREVWAMQLDAMRNRIIRIDLVVAMASFAFFLPTIPAAFFGMNLTSGLEDAPQTFWPVCLASMGVASISFGALVVYWKYFPNKQARRRINDVRALHELLSHHLDDLEEVMVRLRDFCGHSGIPSEGRIDRKHFERLVRRTLVREVSFAEIDLLYRMFDSNRDGCLSLAEVMSHETKFKHAAFPQTRSLGQRETDENKT